MRVTQLSLAGFRSYSAVAADFPPGPQVVVGDNATGNEAHARAKSPNHPDTPLRSGAGGHAAKVQNVAVCMAWVAPNRGPVQLPYFISAIALTWRP
jgi:hypothetical protein